MASTVSVQFEYDESVNIFELSSDWNSTNPGRDQIRVETAINNYAAMMTRGSAAPAVILFKRDDGKGYTVLDGVQRIAAAKKNGATKIAAYVVQCKNDTAKKIRLASNLALNTQAQVNESAQIEKIVEEFMIALGDSAQDVAHYTGRSVELINSVHGRVVLLGKLKSAYESQKKESPPKLTMGVIDTIAKYANLDDFEESPKEVVKFIDALVECNFRNGQANEYVRNFFSIRPKKSVKRSTQLNSRIREFEQDAVVKSRRAGKRVRAPIENVDQAFKALHTVVLKYCRMDCELTESEEEYIAEWSKLYVDVGRKLRSKLDQKMRRAHQTSFKAV